MTAPAAFDTARRKAALALHAMGTDDQQWLLSRLPPPRRAEVQALLQELRDLGIPPDQELLAACLADAPRSVPRSATERLAQLPDGQMRALAQALEAEPPLLVARLLRAHPWSWKQAMAHEFSLSFRNSVEAVPPVPAAPAMDTAVCELVCLRLDALPPAGLEKPGGSWLHGLLQRRGRSA
jgi:hypothetical protein